jgi:hypothetical protein
MGAESPAKGIRTCAPLVLTTIAIRITATCARLGAQRDGRPGQLTGRANEAGCGCDGHGAPYE